MLDRVLNLKTLIEVNKKNKKITIIGSGSFGTAIAHSLAQNKNNSITILSIEKDQVNEINSQHTNSTFFPNRFI